MPPFGDATDTTEPTILFVIADDLAVRDIGCYDGHVHAPHIGDTVSLYTVTGNAANGITLAFDCEEDSIGVASLTVEYGTTLATWPGSANVSATSSGPDADGVVVTVNDVPNPDEVTVNIPASNSASGKLFAPLKAVLLP